jgi:Ca2+-binding RTX toxin-like protein
VSLTTFHKFQSADLAAYAGGTVKLVQPDANHLEVKVKSGDLAALTFVFGGIFDLDGDEVTSGAANTLEVRIGNRLQVEMLPNPVWDTSALNALTDSIGDDAFAALLALLDAGSFPFDHVGASKGGGEVWGISSGSVLHGSRFADDFHGGDGIDEVDGRGGKDTAHLGGGNDDMDGDKGADTLSGEAGDDDLYGGAGDDTLNGGLDGDRLFGGKDDDALYGGGSADLLRGDAGNDLILGDSGNDDLEGGSGRDTLFGGAGDDVLNGAGGFDPDPGQNRIYGGLGDDAMYGGGSDRFIFTSRNGEGHDTLLTADGLADKLVFDHVEGVSHRSDLSIEMTDFGVLVSWGQSSVLVQGITDTSEVHTVFL